MDGRDAHVYEAPEHPKTSIRLLKILSVQAHVSCQFKIVSLDAWPMFSALSYMWGDTEPVLVDGKTLSVTQNLSQAIKDVAYHWEDDSWQDNDEARPLRCYMHLITSIQERGLEQGEAWAFGT
jgi:hypothetical protein